MSRRHDLSLLAAGLETGFWDDHGLPAPWPQDIDEWTPAVDDPPHPEKGESPF
jgi:hypothetical protein